MQMPLIYAIAPDATAAALPEAALPGYMGFSLCDEPPFFLKPAAIPPVSDGWILIQDSEGVSTAGRAGRSLSGL